MKISKLSIDRPITTLMIVLIGIVLGAISFTKLSVDMYPKIDLPIVLVNTTYSGAGPEEIENLVTKPLEGVLGTVNNMENINSTSSNGVSTIMLEMSDSADMNEVVNDVRDKVGRIKSLLPENVDDPMIMKIDINAQPVVEIGVSSDKGLEKLKQIVEDQIQPKFERLDGVASVDLKGAKEKEIKITLFPDKLNGYNLTASQVAQVLRSENINMPAGNVDRGAKEMNVRVAGEFENVEQIRNLPIPSPNGIVYLRDIANVEETFKDMNTYAFINGNSIISLEVKKQSTANVVKVAERVIEEMEVLKNDLTDVQFTVLSDESASIKSSIGNVMNAAIIGGLLAVLVLFVFLRNIRSTLIIGIAIPISVIVTLALMFFSDMTINLTSLGGLSLGIGMLVDSAIVVLENIYRHRKNGEGKKEAAYIGASEVGIAVLASTLTTIAVFLPIIFIEGITAKMFKDMSLTVTYSLVSSLVVAVTVIPMLCSKFLKVEQKTKKKNGVTKFLDAWSRLFERIDKRYQKLLRSALNHKKITSLIVIGVFVGTLSLVPLIGMEFLPSMDTGNFNVSITLPKGTKVEKTLEMSQKVESYAKNIEEMEKTYISVSDNTGKVLIDVGPSTERDRSTKAIMDDMRSYIQDIPGADIKLGSTGMQMMGNSKPVSIQIYGNELDELDRIAKDITKVVENVEGTREVTDSTSEGLPEVQIKVDRNKAALLGFNIQTIAGTLNQAIEGAVATKYKVDGTEMDVSLSYSNEKIKFENDIENILITNTSGVKVPLSDIAEIVTERGPVSINKQNNKLFVTVESDLFGIDTGSAQRAIDKELSDYQMPDGYYYEYGGTTKQMMDSFKDLGYALILAVALVYMILAAQFESFLYPFVIMFSVPLAMTGAIAALFIAGEPLSMTAFIGLIMLAGIVVNNAIVLVEYINQLKKKGHDTKEAILIAGPVRLRPILMTTMTTVLAMVPIALGIGEGTELQAPLAIAVIGGLLLSTLLTLVIIPVNYSIFDNMQRKIAKKVKHKKAVRRSQSM